MAVDVYHVWWDPKLQAQIERAGGEIEVVDTLAAVDPTDEAQLRFVYEKNLVALATLPVVLGYPGMWIRDPATGVDAVRLVHVAVPMRDDQRRPLEVRRQRFGQQMRR